jgi:hypothetical protein
MSQVWVKQSDGLCNAAYYPQTVPNAVGPWGQPVPVMAPAKLEEPTGADFAKAALAQSYPPDLLRQTGFAPNPSLQGSGIQRTAACPPGGCPAPGAVPPGYGAPPPGLPALGSPLGPPGAVAAIGALTGGPALFPVQRTEVRFVGPAGMRISWYAPRPDGKSGFSSQYLEAPARYNFLQASIYRLKLSDIPNRPGVELYPTLEVVPAKAKTCTFLAHSAVPVNFTEEDFEQVLAGNFVVKVIYLPDPQFQDLAATGPDEVVSSRLEPGVDPIVEAQRRGSILLVVRLGNIDLEAPNTPPMDAPDPMAAKVPPPGVAAARPPLPPGLMPPGMPPLGMPGPGPMVPYGARPPGAGAPPSAPSPALTPPGGVPSAPSAPVGVPGPAAPPGTAVPPGASAPATPLGRLPATAPASQLGRLPATAPVRPVSYPVPPASAPTVAELAGAGAR